MQNSQYIDITDDIIGRKVLYDDSEVGIVIGKAGEGNEKRGSDYTVQLNSGRIVYITDRSFDKFKMLK